MDVNEVIEKTFNIVGAQVRKLVGRIEIDLSPSLPEISGHFQKLEQVAATFWSTEPKRSRRSPKGCSASPRNTFLISTLCSWRWKTTASEWSPRSGEQIFEPFFTTNARPEDRSRPLGFLRLGAGTQGDHRVLSKPGIGTRFAVLLL